MDSRRSKIAFAVIAAMASTVVFSQPITVFPEPDPDQKFDAEGSTADSTWNGIGIVQGNKGTFLDTGSLLTNSGIIWVLGEGNTANIQGMLVGSGRDAVNNGAIYAKGVEGQADRTKAIAMIPRNPNSSDDPSEIVNGKDGLIVVESATAMQQNSNTYIGGGWGKVSNEGRIVVLNEGYGILAGYGNAERLEFSNAGSIEASGEHAYGFSAGDSHNTIFNNSGVIIATDGATAIHVKDFVDTDSGESFAGTPEFTLNLSGASSITGTIDLNKESDVNITNLDSAQTLTLKDDARMIRVVNSTVTFRVAVDGQTLTIKELDTKQGTTDFIFSTIGTETNKLLDIESLTGTVEVGYDGTVSDMIALDNSRISDLFNGIHLGDQEMPDSVYVAKNGAWGDEAIYYRDENGNITSDVLSTNSLLTSATDLALINALTWRTQLSNLTDRMGTLRTMPNSAGAWARYNNGRYDGRGIEHDFNTIEVGVDAAVSKNFLVGVSFDYTNGDTDLDAGASENDTYTVGLYGTYFADNGSFLDLMAKIGRIDSEYDLNNGIAEKGDYMMTGAIVGIEGGHRFNVNNFFVEPQIQLSYSWLRASSYSTNIRNVDFDTVESLVARAGVMGGITFAENRGAAYLKASYNHDFLGDVEGNFSGVVNGESISRRISDELDDNWGEVSLGASYSVTNALNAFVDVGTSFGADIDQKWRINLGARYMF